MTLPFGAGYAQYPPISWGRRRLTVPRVLNGQGERDGTEHYHEGLRRHGGGASVIARAGAERLAVFLGLVLAADAPCLGRPVLRLTGANAFGLVFRRMPVGFHFSPTGGHSSR